MNKNDIILVKESICEYCEGIYGECLTYMRKNNINYDLSGNDRLSELLREIDSIQGYIKNVNDIDILFNIREECFKKARVIREMIG